MRKPFRPLPYYSLRQLEKRTGVPRLRLAGLIEGLGIPAYHGPRRSIYLDNEGLVQLEAYLESRDFPGSAATISRKKEPVAVA